MINSERNTAVVVLISGSGSNLQAIIDATQRGDLDIEIKAVISNRPGVQGIQRAAKAGIPTETLDHKAFTSRTEFDRALQQCIDSYHPELLVLAGFMRILTTDFVRHYQGRLLNIHPSLLPKYPGLNTHQRAIEAQDSEHGASVHFVTEELDGGPLIIQGRVAIQAGDTPTQLAKRVLHAEHKIYPQAIQWFSQGLLQLVDNHVLFNKEPRHQPFIFNMEEERGIDNES
ncbi:MAG: phosphoribosylglycinamide formyltransferase [Gammaproteobacteria bacterium]|nr:phosphoribosylglycinamide formyltransferase [Gammaproteobacteria bacterium]MCF6231014.1 phosphoribosylglycinamide formyltransferase [Gammaproteobacteria bacterium]